MRYQTLFIFVFICAILLACTAAPLVITAQMSAPTLTPFAPQAATQTAEIFLAEPEKVVQAFLTDVQEAPAQVNSYLSQAMQKKYPGSEVIHLLDLPGDINGFAIKSVDANVKNPLAFVTVGLESKSEIMLLRFTLIVEHSTWVIDGVDHEHINP